MINPSKLVRELKAANIKNGGCNEHGIVWDVDGTTEIQDRPDVAQVIANHDPTPVPVESETKKLADLLIEKEIITQDDYDNTKEMKP